MKNINIKNYIKLFSNLTPEKIKFFDDLIDENIIFIDPFNNIKGSNEFKKIFYHMFKSVKDPKFLIIDYLVGKNIVFLKWKMSFNAFNSSQQIEGVSELRINEEGKIYSHIDYWDSLNGLFIKLPFIGIIYRLSLKMFKVN
ncbi:MAG: nuclear transport factor 2 family protein [Alphaproteobacteria bacterium]|jgi:steroid delta-isomerase|nr:nuclear transport factor 2 family protein [Alphaproteobacteria bacterium]